MRTEKITRAQASLIHMRPRERYGIISDGCACVWGDGRTVEAAKKNATKHIMDLCGNDILSQLDMAPFRYPTYTELGEIALAGCWLVQVE